MVSRELATRIISVSMVVMIAVSSLAYDYIISDRSQASSGRSKASEAAAVRWCSRTPEVSSASGMVAAFRTRSASQGAALDTTPLNPLVLIVR